MSTHSKYDYCLNCNFSLKEEQQYCPNCGQENRNRKVPLKQLILDFLGDYFTFDSKFFRSTIYLLIRPGFLTNEYNSGKRMKYIPPVRMYVFISILFFFVANITKNSDEEEQKHEDNRISIGDTTELKGKKGAFFSMESGNLDVSVGQEREIFTKEQLEKAVKNDINMDALFDSLKIGRTKFRKFIAKVIITQSLKLREQKENFSSYYMKNVSIMMFFLMPLFAILLKLFYIRRKRYYIEHLVFSFHIHSFAFLVLAVTELFEDNLIDIIAFLLIFFYLLFALKKVYQQSWGKTVLKFFITFISYLFTLTLCIFATVVITFLFF